MEKKLIVIFSIPRTGSNHLVRLLQQYPAVDARFELFHPQEGYSIRQDEVEAAARITGHPFESAKDPNFVAWARSHPAAVLDIIEKTYKLARVLAIKIFPGHLPDALLTAEILSKPDVYGLILKRRPIDSFISLVKAEHLRDYAHVDNTGLRVEISADRFIRWWEAQASWYGFVQAELDRLGVPNQTMTYEQDIDLPPAACLTGMGARFRAFGLDLPVEDFSNTSGLSKQDTNTDYGTKVSNWTEFERELKARGYYDRAFAYF